MPVRFENFDYSYTSQGRSYFAPSSLGRKIGADIKLQVEQKHKFDPFVYHLRGGGHVAAMHSHRDHHFFARIDIRRFFYSISRSRVQRALQDIGILRARHYAKWSCVKNPYLEPPYSLPYGFVQSPVLATLVLMQSGAGTLLRVLDSDPEITASVYMDDISLSSDNKDHLQVAYAALLETLAAANFEVSPLKLRPPASQVDLFNCDLRHGHAEVRADRVAEFLAGNRTSASMVGFARYQMSVEDGNGP
jgi:hypothetical protein